MAMCGSSIDHAVQVVGLDLSTNAWKVRNSWGTSWGEAGYIYLAYGKNTCDLTYMPTFTDAALA
jgi:C1A family cysteine protease